jgi:hypothetical protein
MVGLGPATVRMAVAKWRNPWGIARVASCSVRPLTMVLLVGASLLPRRGFTITPGPLPVLRQSILNCTPDSIQATPRPPRSTWSPMGTLPRSGPRSMSQSGTVASDGIAPPLRPSTKSCATSGQRTGRRRGPHSRGAGPRPVSRPGGLLPLQLGERPGRKHCQWVSPAVRSGAISKTACGGGLPRGSRQPADDAPSAISCLLHAGGSPDAPKRPHGTPVCRFDRGSGYHAGKSTGVEPDRERRRR